MDSRYRFSTSMPQYYNPVSNITNNSSNTNSTPNNTHYSKAPSNRYFHRVPLLFPHNHQQRLRSPPPKFSSSYLGPLKQHRTRFLSTWDLTPRPTIYNSSRNISTRSSTPISMSKQHDEGSCILNSCVHFFN